MLASQLEAQVAQLQGTIQDLQQQNATIDRERLAACGALDKAQKDGIQKDQALRASMEDRTQLKQALDATLMRVRDADDRLSTTVEEKSLVQSHFEQVNVEKDRLQAQVHQVVNENKAL